MSARSRTYRAVIAVFALYGVYVISSALVRSRSGFARRAISCSDIITRGVRHEQRESSKAAHASELEFRDAVDTYVDKYADGKSETSAMMFDLDHAYFSPVGPAVVNARRGGGDVHEAIAQAVVDSGMLGMVAADARRMLDALPRPSNQEINTTIGNNPQRRKIYMRLGILGISKTIGDLLTAERDDALAVIMAALHAARMQALEDEARERAKTYDTAIAVGADTLYKRLAYALSSV